MNFVSMQRLCIPIWKNEHIAKWTQKHFKKKQNFKIILLTILLVLLLEIAFLMYVLWCVYIRSINDKEDEVYENNLMSENNLGLVYQHLLTTCQL